ncbi:hypothetical protein Tco_0844484 [Tanacetum coccineum]
MINNRIVSASLNAVDGAPTFQTASFEPTFFILFIARIRIHMALTEGMALLFTYDSALKDAQLRYLNLSHSALGEKGVRAFRELLKSQAVIFFFERSKKCVGFGRFDMSRLLTVDSYKTNGYFIGWIFRYGIGGCSVAAAPYPCKVKVVTFGKCLIYLMDNDLCRS